MDDAASKILNIEIENKKRVAKEYNGCNGTCWGIPRALLSKVYVTVQLYTRFSVEKYTT